METTVDGAVRVLSDWMRANADRFVPPPPASDADLAALVSRGAPSALVSLYRVVGRDLPGLFSGAELLRPGLVTEEEGAWAFAVGGDEDLVLRDGAVFESGPEGDVRLADSLEALLTQRLAAFLEGHMVWDEVDEEFVPREVLAERRILADLADQAAGHPGTLRIWTAEIVADLLALRPGGAVPLADLGSVTVSTRQAQRWVDADGTERSLPGQRIVRLRPAAWTRSRTRAPDPRKPATIRGIELTEERRRALSVAVSDAVGDATLAGRPIWWPGLAMFRASPRSTAPVMRAAPVLKRALNPEDP